jgi:hypothetical protein
MTIGKMHGKLPAGASVEFVVLYILYYRLCDESLRWLIANGRLLEATNLIKNISVVYTTKKYGPNITKTFVAVLHLRVINNDEHNSY